MNQSTQSQICTLIAFLSFDFSFFNFLDRDLKPGNILVSKDCKLRITDIGLARFVDEATAIGENSLNPLTEYVVTR